MAQGAVKLWVGLGAMLVASSAAAQTANPHAGHGSAPAQVAPGGEGGEGGEGDAFAGLTEHQALAGRLLLIRGHLLVGRELYEAGRPDDALQHYMHPTEELWADVEEPMKKKKLGKVQGLLLSLANAVKNKKPKAEIAQLQAQVDQGLAKGIPVFQQPSTIYNVAIAVLQTAASEYEVAVTDGKFTNVAEYQDGRGFVAATARYLAGYEKLLRTKNSEAYGTLSVELAELRKAWPSTNPPDRPLVEPGQVQARVSRMEFAKGDFR